VKKLRVLALEADRHSLGLLKAMLRMSGIERVRATTNVDLAYRGLLEETFDVAIMRVDSPRFDSFSMLKLVRELHRPDLPVLLVLNDGNQMRIKTFASLGKVAAVVKPMSARQVADRVVALSRPRIRRTMLSQFLRWFSPGPSTGG
jgi:DNA-binding response OmpR family regulator